MDVALQSSVWVTSPEFAGYLMKRGFHWRKLWKRRWIALHGAEIVYMDKEPTVENSSNLVITKAQITAATVIDRDDIDGNPNGFAIHVNDGHTPTWYLRAESSREKKSWLMRLAHVHAIVRWLEDFEKVKVLGVGGTGIVYELLHKTNGQRFAMKEMEIKNKAQMNMAIQEAEMLKDIMENISHPNIMHIEKVFQVGSKFYLVFPLCTGGELYEHIIRKGHFTEEDAALLTKDLITGLHALHEHDILHLDIKPENLLFESDAPDAKIKITDFGLSKMFSNSNNESDRESGSSKMPTMAELEEKLRQFQESGVLNRERLRGTVGYMSPELILVGHCSKATDVFAAGVVLYILLCGHPPFQSKSNREVLEKTARGAYRMDGEEWDDISDDAKDLVRRMLIVDPSQRITTTEILNHPWIKSLEEMEDEVVVVETPEVKGDSTPSRTMTKTISKRMTGRKGTGANLASALRLLSGHVQQRRSEKIAASFTKLVSSLQHGNNSTALMQYVKPMDGSSFAEVPKEEESMLLMNPDVRDALSLAIHNLGDENGKLSIEQFVSLLKHLGFAPASVNSNTTTALPLMLLCRFVDRDGDGYISADDIFTAQALASQRSEIFIRGVFRIYSEAIWYPGRQLNLMHLQRTAPKKPGVANKVLEENLHTDVVEPPKFITGRHVSAIFEKLGLDPAGGQKLFTALCEVLSRVKEDNGEPRESTIEESPEEYLNSSNDSISPSVSSPPPPPPPSSGTPNAALAAAFGKLGMSSTAAASNNADLPTPPASASISASSRQSESTISSPSRDSLSSQTAGAAGAATASQPKMDVNDFIKACEIDETLILVLVRRPRAKIAELIKKSQMMYDSTQPTFTESENLEEITKQRRRSATSVLEEEFNAAMRSSESSSSSKKHFPIANAVGRATISAALGLANRMSMGAQVLKEAIEGGDGDQVDSDDEEEEGIRRYSVDEDYEGSNT